MKKSKLIIGSMTLLLSLMGCSGGASHVSSTSTTMGQELQDLNVSYQQEIISKKQYERAKKEILKRYE
jgi:hypothetical protein